MNYKPAGKILFVLILALTIAACSSKDVNLTVNTNAASANSSAGASSTPTPTPAAATIAPDALVADLYKQHDAKKSPFFQTKDRALVDKFFTKTLGDLIWNDAKTSSGEVGALDFDPLYNAQDVSVKNFKVGASEIKDKTAVVPVTFNNYESQNKLLFTLVEDKSGWKIDDIKYDGDGSTLRGIFRESASTADSEFEGKYRVGETTCTVKPVKMAFEVRWEKGSGTEMFFFKESDKGKSVFESEGEKTNLFIFDTENYNTGTFQRADGRTFPVKRIK
jgi:hypothetical protein